MTSTLKQKDLLDLMTALVKFNCSLSTTVATQCTAVATQCTIQIIIIIIIIVIVIVIVIIKK